MRKTITRTFFSCLLIAVGVGGCAELQNQKEIIYVGTFSGRDSQGLYVFEFDRKTGQLGQIQTVSDRRGPNFQALHPDGTYLYSVSGEAFSEDAEYGTVSAYRIDRETGILTVVNEQSTAGRGPAHVSVDPQGRFAYVSNYGAGSLSVFAIREDGGLTESVDTVQHEGSSINEQRQGRPHVHSIVSSADGRFIYVSDLGIDKIVIYEVDPVTGTLVPASTPHVDTTPGAGPRHFTIHPNGAFAYAAEELSSTVAAFSVDRSTGALTPIQRINMLPSDFDGESTAADIHVSPDGRFLYASNRGHDSLVIYEIEESAGTLSLVGHEPTRGGHPRNFMVDQNGEFVLVVNRDNDSVNVFRRDKATGELSYTGEQVNVPMAVCVTQNIMK